MNRVLVAGLLALAACAPAKKGLVKVLGTFQAPPDFALIFNDRGASVTLSYGAPESGDRQLMLSCYDASGRIMASDFWQDSLEVTVRSGEAEAKFGGRLSGPGEGSAEPWTDFWIKPESPPLAAFRKSGDLTLISGKRTLAIRARPEEMAAIESFFAACEKP